MSVTDRSWTWLRGLTVSPFPVLAELLDTVSLDEFRVPGLWLFMRLELAEKLIKRTLILLRQVMLEEVRNV